MVKTNVILAIFTVLSLVAFGIVLLLSGKTQLSGYTSEPNISPTAPLIPTVTPTPSPHLIGVPSSTPTPSVPKLKAITLSGFAYEDRNNDGMFNSDDPKLPNMELKLYDTFNGEQVSTLFSAPDGGFSLNLSVRGGLKITPVAYNNFTPKSAEKTIYTSNANLSFGFRSVSAPVANYTIGIIEGDVYQDANRNKNRDNGETGVFFYKLYLIDTKGNYYNTTQDAQTTDPGGHFKYTNLPVGDTYRLELSNPSGEYEIFQPSTSVKLTSTESSKVGIQILVYKN